MKAGGKDVTVKRDRVTYAPRFLFASFDSFLIWANLTVFMRAYIHVLSSARAGEQYRDSTAH